MSSGWLIVLIIVVLAFILSNIFILKKNTRMSLPDSYLDRKKREAEYLSRTGQQPTDPWDDKDD